MTTPLPEPGEPYGAPDSPGALEPAPGVGGRAAKLWRESRADVLAAVVVVVVCGLLAVGLGFLWAGIAPRVPWTVTDPGVAGMKAPEAEQAIGADGVLAIIGVAAGLVLAPLAFWRLRRYGIGVAVGLAAGGVLGAFTISWVGHALGPDSLLTQLRHAKVGATLYEPLIVRATGVLYLWPLVSLIVFLGLSAGFAPPDDREPVHGEPAPGEPVPAMPWASGPDLTKH